MLVTEGARESCMHVFYLQGSDEDVKDEQPSEKTEPKQLTPREALERIHAARVSFPDPS